MARKQQKKKRDYPETTLQIECVSWFRRQFPDLVLAAYNANSRSPRAGKMNKDKGVLAGVPDLLILQPSGKFSGLLVELKIPDGALSPKQKALHVKLSLAGYQVLVCRTIDEFSDAVLSYFS